MDPEIQKKEITRLDLLSKIISVLFGVFITSVIFAICLQSFNETGIYLALALCVILSILGFYYTKKNTILRFMTWAMAVTIALGATLFLVALHYASNMLEGF